MKFKIISKPRYYENSLAYTNETIVLNADTNEPIQGIQKVTFEHNTNGQPILSLDIVCPDIEIETDKISLHLNSKF